MTTKEIISHLQFTIIKIANAVAGKYRVVLSADDKEDLLQLISLQLLLYPEDKIQQLYKERRLENFIYGIVKNQIVSCTSDFYRQNRRCNNNIPIDQIEDPWYEDKKFQ